MSTLSALKNTEDLEILAGKRGDRDQRAIRWADLIEANPQIVKALTSGKAMSEAVAAIVGEIAVGDDLVAQALAAAEAASQQADALAQDLTNTAQGLANDIAAVEATVTDEIDALSAEVANLAAQAGGIQRTLDEASDGTEGASVTVTTGPAALGQTGTVIITEGATARTFTGQTSGFSFPITQEEAVTLTGRRVRISVLAKQPATNGADRFGVTYVTAASGNSGYISADKALTTDWQWFTFFYDMPTTGSATDYLGIWGDEDKTGKATQVAKVIIEPSQTASELAEIAAIQADLDLNYYTNVETDGVVTAAVLALQAALEDPNGTSVGASLDAFQTAQTTTNSAVAASISTLQTNLGTVTANLSANYYTKSAADSAVAASITALKAQIEDPDGASVGATLDDFATAQTTTNEAIAGKTTNIEAHLAAEIIPYTPNPGLLNSWSAAREGRPDQLAPYSGSSWSLGTHNRLAALGPTATDTSYIYTRAALPVRAGDKVQVDARWVQYGNAQTGCRSRFIATWLDHTFAELSTIIGTVDADVDQPLSFTAPASAYFFRIGVKLMADWVAPAPEVTLATFRAKNVQSEAALQASIDTVSAAQVSGDAALASQLTTVQATANGASALATANQTAVADIEGNLAAGVIFKAQAGNQVSLLDLVAADNPLESYSIAKIAASWIILQGSVAADMLVVGRATPGYALENGSLSDASGAGWSNTDFGGYGGIRPYGGDNHAAVQGSMPAANAFWANGIPTGESESAYNKTVAVQPGEQYVFLWSGRNVTSNLRTCGLAVRWTLYDGSYSYHQASLAAPPTGTWTNYQHTYTVPDGVKEMTPRVVFQGDDAAGAAYVAACDVIPKTSGGILLKDGTVTAQHVDTGSFSVEGLALFNGTLQSTSWGTSTPNRWQINNDGSATFYEVEILRDLTVASGSYSLTTSMDVTLWGVLHERWVNTGVSISSWGAVEGAHVVEASTSGGLSSNGGTTTSRYWGVIARQIEPRTRWDGNSTIWIKLELWGQYVKLDSGDTLNVNWKLKRVT